MRDDKVWMGRCWIQSDSPCQESCLSFKFLPSPRTHNHPSTQNLSCMGGRISTLTVGTCDSSWGASKQKRDPRDWFQGEICHRALEDQPALQGMKDVYLAFNTSQSHQPHLCVTVTTTSHPTLLMVPEFISPLRTEGEATGTAVGKSRKNTKSLTFLELLLPPIYRENTRFISGVCRDCRYQGHYLVSWSIFLRELGGKCFGNIELIHIFLFTNTQRTIMLQPYHEGKAINLNTEELRGLISIWT